MAELNRPPVDKTLEPEGGQQDNGCESDERDRDRRWARQHTGQGNEARAGQGEQNRKVQEINAERQPAKTLAKRQQPL
jgi:hypothetical protein